MKEVVTGIAPGIAPVKKKKNIGRTIALIGAVAVFVLFGICIICSSKSVTERDVKVRYDGQTYTGQGDSYSSYGNYRDSFGFGVTNSSKAELADSAAGVGFGDPTFAPVYEENDMADYDVSDIYDADGIAAGKKLVYTYDYTVESMQFDAFIQAFSVGMDAIGAYPERMFVDRREYDTLDGLSSNEVRRATYTLRVPADRMPEFKALLGTELSDITYENVRMSDRTEAYADAELQAQSYKAEYARLEELIEQAESVTELIAIQDRLSNLNYLIEQQEKQREWIDEDVAMSQVNLTVYEVVYYTAVVEKYRYRIGERIADAFADFVSSMPSFLFGLIYLFLGGLVIVLLGYIMAAAVMNIRNKKARDQVVRLVPFDSKNDT